MGQMVRWGKPLVVLVEGAKTVSPAEPGENRYQKSSQANDAAQSYSVRQLIWDGSPNGCQKQNPEPYGSGFLQHGTRTIQKVTCGRLIVVDLVF